MNPHHLESPTRREQDLNLFKTYTAPSSFETFQKSLSSEVKVV